MITSSSRLANTPFTRSNSYDIFNPFNRQTLIIHALPTLHTIISAKLKILKSNSHVKSRTFQENEIKLKTQLVYYSERSKELLHMLQLLKWVIKSGHHIVYATQQLGLKDGERRQFKIQKCKLFQSISNHLKPSAKR